MSKQVLLNGRGLVVAADGFWGLQGHINWDTASAVAASLNVPYALELSNLRVELQTAPGTGKTRTFTIFHGLVDTGITVTFGAADSGVKSDTSHTYSVPVNGQVYIKSSSTGTPATSGIKWSVMIESDDDAKTALMGHCQTLTTLPVFLTLAGVMSNAGSSNESLHELVIPCNGTIKDFRVNLQNQPGGQFDARTFTVRKNGSDTSLEVGLADTSFQGLDAGSVSVSQGDVICVKHVVISSPDASQASFSLTFTPSNRGNFIIGVARGTGHNTITAKWETVQGPTSRVTTGVNLSEQLCGNFDITGLTVDLDTAPGSGNSYTYQPGINGSTVGSALVISGASTSGSQAQSFSVSAGEAMAMRVTPASNPAAGLTTLSLVGFISDPAPPAADVSAMMMGANF